MEIEMARSYTVAQGDSKGEITTVQSEKWLTAMN